jgi:hypothetical protein
MKLNTLLRALLLTAMFAMTVPSFAAEDKPATMTTNETAQEHVQRLEKRLEEIKAMDIEKLSRSEKKALRGEVRAIKKEMKAVTGVYISIGALLIIILLIILLA